MRVKPGRPGLRVLDPVSKRPLHADGREVPESGYWMRRLACGDVVLVEQEPIPDSADAAPQDQE